MGYILPPFSVAFCLFVFGSLGLGLGICFMRGGNGLMIGADVT